ncbi:MAG: hypothetical protein KC613_22945, partial [Myxococcales bacterium]|nr:hypothetical protein [Myxococcales bacterium]
AGARPGAPDLWRARVQVRRGHRGPARAALDSARAAAVADAPLLGEIAAALAGLGEWGRALAAAADAAAAGDQGAAMRALLARPLPDAVAELVGCVAAIWAGWAVPAALPRARAAAEALREAPGQPPAVALLAMACVDPEPDRAALCVAAAWATRLRDPQASYALFGRSLARIPTPMETAVLVARALGLPGA